MAKVPGPFGALFHSIPLPTTVARLSPISTDWVFANLAVRASRPAPRAIAVGLPGRLGAQRSGPVNSLEVLFQERTAGSSVNNSVDTSPGRPQRTLCWQLPVLVRRLSASIHS